MKRVILVLLVVLVPAVLFAQDLDLNKYSKNSFNDLTNVLGRVLGTGLIHSGGVHGPGGFDVGIKAGGAVVPGDMKNNTLDDVNVILVPSIQATLGLPGKIEVSAKYFSYEFGEDPKETVSITTGIIKYNLVEGLVYPNLSIFTSYTRMSGISDFKVNNITLGAVAGKGLPLVSFYGGAYYNYTILSVDLPPDQNLYPGGFSEKIQENNVVIMAGFSVSLAPFSKINLEYNAGNISTVNLGLIFSIF